MASLIASSVQAMASGMSAMADKQQNDLQAQWRLETITHREYSLRWRTEDVFFREMEKEWRETDNKRHVVDEKSKQVTLMAELCALLAGFQMIMFYETGQPPVSEYWPSTVLLSVWGAMCVCVSCLYITIMVVAGMMNFSIFQVSAHEGLGQLRSSLQGALYTSDGGNPEGFVVSAEQFLHLWQARFDDRFRQLVRAFSLGIPGFMANMAVTIIVKFEASMPGAWVGFGVAILGVFTWWRSHSAIISYLLWRAAPGTNAETPLPTPLRAELNSDSGKRSKLSFIREDDEEASEASPGKNPPAGRKPHLGSNGAGKSSSAANSRARRASEQRVLESPPAAPPTSQSAPTTPLGSDSQTQALEGVRAWWRASTLSHSHDNSIAEDDTRRLDRSGRLRSLLGGASPARSSPNLSGETVSASAPGIQGRERFISSNSSGGERSDNIRRKEDAKEPFPVPASLSSEELGPEDTSTASGGWWFWKAAPPRVFEGS